MPEDQPAPDLGSDALGLSGINVSTSSAEGGDLLAVVMLDLRNILFDLEDSDKVGVGGLW
jgi:hypothetical protein